jgi:hypothetical protein
LREKALRLKSCTILVTLILPGNLVMPEENGRLLLRLILLYLYR